MSIVVRHAEQRPEPAAHGPGAITTCSPTSIAALARLTADTEPSSRDTKPVTSTPSRTRDSLAEALVAQPEHRLDVEREAALVLVETDGHALRAPVGKERLHVRVDLGLARDQLGAVADPLLALETCGEVRLLHRGTERDVADGVVVVCGRIRLPDLDARLHQLAHRGLEVVVADDAAGDSRGPRARLRLVEHDDVCAGPGTAGAKLLREVVGGRETVDAGADDDVGRTLRNGHYCLLTNRVACTRTAR